MFRRNQSEDDRQAEIQRHAESVLFQLEQLIPAIEADQPRAVEKHLRELNLVMLRVPKHYRGDVAGVVSYNPIGQYACGLLEIYKTLNESVILSEHAHIHGLDRQPDRA